MTTPPINADCDSIHDATDEIDQVIQVSSSDMLVYLSYMKRLDLQYEMREEQIHIYGAPIATIKNITPEEKSIIDGLFIRSLYIYWQMGLVVRGDISMDSNVYLYYKPNGGGQLSSIVLYYFPSYIVRFNPGVTAGLTSYLKSHHPDYTCLAQAYPKSTVDDIMKLMYSARQILHVASTETVMTRKFIKGDEDKTHDLTSNRNIMALAALYNIYAEDRYDSMSACIEYILGIRKESGDVDAQYISSLPLERFTMLCSAESILYVNMLLAYNSTVGSPIHIMSFNKILNFGKS